jgi:hypothetical protein
MKLDIRLPLGLMFTAIGLLLAVYGALAEESLPQRASGININLWWGLGMLVFGGVTLWVGRRSEPAADAHHASYAVAHAEDEPRH